MPSPRPVLLLLAVCAAAAGCSRDPVRPNFVVILADDLGYGDLGCQGSESIRTPRLDRMAAEGLRLTSFYSATVCAPARAALLTGRYPLRSGVPRNLESGTAGGLPPAEVTIAELLADAGYATACIGKWHLGERAQYLPVRQGFQTFDGSLRSNSMRAPWVKGGEDPVLREGSQPVGRITDETNAQLTHWVTERAVSFIREHQDQPFFLYLSHYMPHIPLGTVEPFLGRSGAGLYGDVVETLDWSTGQVLDALRECGLDERTLVVFTSDNGPRANLPPKDLQGGVQADHHGSVAPLRGGKGSVMEGGPRVPCLVRWPGRIPPQQVSDAIVTTLDLLPTFAGYAGVPLPGDRVLDGLDHGAFLEGRAEGPRHEFHYYNGRDVLGIRRDQWKLRVLADGEQLGLFHLGEDPGEHDPRNDAHRDTVKELRQAMRAFHQALKEDPSRSEFR